MVLVGRKKATVANLVFQYSSLLLAITGIVLIPLYLRFIDIKLYGAWLATGDIINWLSMFDPGLNDLLRQQVANYYGAKKWDLLGKSIGTGWFIIAIMSLLTVLTGCIISFFVPGLFELPAESLHQLQLSIIWAAIGAGLVFFSGCPGSVQQGLLRSDKYVAIYLVSWLTGISLTVFLLFKGFGLISIPLGSVARGIISTLGSGLDVMVVTAKIKVRMRWSKEYLYSIKGLLGSTLLNRVSRILATSCDAFFIGVILGPAVVPIVDFTKKLWVLVIVFAERISTAFIPGLSHLWGEGDSRKFNSISRAVLKATIWVLGLQLAVVLFANKSFIGIWVGQKFYAGDTFNVLSALAAVSFVYVSAICQILFSAGVIKGPALATAIQGAFRVVLLAGCLLVIGIMSVPVSTMVTSVIVLAVYLFGLLGRVIKQTDGNLLKTAAITGLAGLAIGLTGNYYISMSSWFGLLAGCVLAGAAYIILLIVLDSEFRKLAYQFVCKIKFHVEAPNG
jgi:O-antigen/teichoic acid export membrane protein